MVEDSSQVREEVVTATLFVSDVLRAGITRSSRLRQGS